ncbi:MAG: phenylalanine--tRNA ligase subunit beta, partial [Bacteroidaceae bacterium]|nr:phenylalanine--tRNA ligase subunit beta [Bacteroidaceae bacterium]
MNISYKWLKEYVDVNLSAEEIAVALTSIGLEVGGVEEVQAIKGGLEGLVVGHVLSMEVHPNSDHMHICQVDLGQGEPVQIVCGAANVDAGQKVIVATLGTKLYSGDECFTIKRSKLRGVESLGMICAEDEIGVGTSHDGIIVLPEDTPVGMKAADYFNIQSDWLIEVDITPNRADACSHWGVARDLYAWLVRNGYETKLHRPSVDDFKVDNNNLPIAIEVENTEACPRYCAVTISGVEVKESPEWLKEKLEIIGLRPINNIVDITNYIMMAYGQPLHCFDADMIEGGKVVVKSMPEGTPFVTLDGVEHKLSDRDLAICNAVAPMCIAGVFGGKGSGTYETTKNVLIESAYFHPTWIRKSARRHGLQTDASFRFERGIDPDIQIYALKRAAQLIKELAGGEISMDIVDVESPELVKKFSVDVTYDYIYSLIGKNIGNDVVKEILTSLEMKIVSETAEGLSLEVPAYRVDVQRAPDVVEDILRIYGYNNVEIPTAVKSSLTIKGNVDAAYKLENLVSEQLVGCGFNEILNNSLTREAYYDGLQTYKSECLVRLMNPLSSDLNVMRQSLLFGGLEVVRHNVNRRNANLRLFEFGNCYYFNEGKRNPEKVLSAYSEDQRLGLWLTGKRVEGSWAHPNEDASFYELKAYDIVSARLWGDVVKSRANYAQIPELLRTSPNHGAVDGFPVKVYADGVYQGRYTLNIPKDAWMANMDDELDNHCILCGENYVSGCFRAEANIDESDWTDEVHDIVPASIKNRWNEAIRFVMNSTDEEFVSGIGNYFDVESLIDYYLYGVIICNNDGFGKNQLFFTYDGQKWIASAYDIDNTFGLYLGGLLAVDFARNQYEDYKN